MKYTSKSVSGKSKSKPFYAKIFLPMVFLTLIQFFTFVIVLMFGGEFSYIKKYAYNTLVEKTANRKN